MRNIFISLGLLLAAPAFAGSPLAPDSPWPKFRGGMRQDGRSSVLPTLEGGAFWSVRTAKGVYSSPVIGGDGTIYIGSADRYFYALNPDGTTRWRVLTGEIIDSAALLDDKGRVYFGGGDGKLRALDARTGRSIWTFEADQPAVNGAFINWFEGNVAIGANGDLYAPNDNFAVYAIDRDTGVRRWQWLMNDQTWSSPAVDPASGNLFIGNNYLAALKWFNWFWKNTFALRPDGSQLWRTSVRATIAASPMLTEDGKMLVGAFDGYLRAYDQNSGRELWAVPTNDHVYASPALLPDGKVVQASTDGFVYALDAETGAVAWTFDAGDPIHSSPSIDGLGDVYFGGGDGRLYVLNADGSLRWSMQLITEERNDLNSSPALGPDAIYIAGESGEIFSVPYDYCLRPAQARNPSCVRGGETVPADAVALDYVSPLGATKKVIDAKIPANQPLAFALRVREDGQGRLALLDQGQMTVHVEPATELDVAVSGDRRFVTIVPKTRFPAGAVRLTVSGTYLVDPTRDGLRFVGGRAGGSYARTFAFEAVEGPANAQLPDVMEMKRLSVPLPTVLPSYNQIGFDSLHYTIGKVETNGTHAIGWIAGAKLAADDSGTIPDGETKVLFPVEMSFENGLLTLRNEDGFMVNAMNADVPFTSFRVSGMLGADGGDLQAPGVHVTTKCNDIPTYGPFLANLGFCNPETDIMNVYGSAMLRPLGDGRHLPPTGVGAASFHVRPATIFAPGKVGVTLSGATILPSEHSLGILLVDAQTGRPVSLQYGLQTVRTTHPDGSAATVTLDLASKKALPARVRAYLMVDSYPAAKAELELR